MFTRFKTYLQAPVDGRVLGIFRMLYGLFMAFEMIYYLRIDLVKNMFVLPSVNFKYDGLGWLEPLPEPAMDTLVWLLLGMSLLMTAGIWFKWAARIFALGNAFIFFQDMSLYNNHIYLYILIAWLLSYTHADQFYTLGKKRGTQIGRWESFIIQFQLVIVYFYAAIVKLKYDWLVRQEPIRSLITGIEKDSWLSPVVKNEVAVYILNYGGLLLDLVSPILLWYKPLRRWAIYLFMGFHLFNSTIFDDIAFFPFVMLAGLVIFYEPHELFWFRWLPLKPQVNPNRAEVLPMGIGMQYLFMGYFIFQLLFPLRGFFLPNQLDWTTIGNKFSWRVKADSRGIEELTYQVLYKDGQVASVDVGSFINTHQVRMLINDPRAARALAIAIKSVVKKQGGDVAAVKARIRLRYNGRPPQYFVNPDIDLSQAKYSPFEKLVWVVPVH